MGEDKFSDVKFSIVVPVYNSEDTLGALYQRISATMEKHNGKFELIFVDDGSVDGSWKIISKIAQQDEKVISIKLMRNYGQAGATMCGLKEAKGQFIVTIDDDLQTPPEEITKLINFIEEHTEIDVLLGDPIKKGHSLWRRVGSKFLNWVNRRMFDMNKRLNLTSFRIIRRAIVDELLRIRTPHPAIGPMLCKTTPSIGNIPVEHNVRVKGRGHYSPGKILTLTLDKILSFSIFPLRFIAVIGLVGISFCITLGLFYSVRYLRGGVRVSGWITLVLLLIGLSGFNFFAFGIFGEYLLRILQTSNQIPQYLIREIVSKPRDRDDSSTAE